MQSADRDEPARSRGRLKIGDDWNAITIIALSQSSPLKAIAELVENSIDAKARTITVTRGRDHGQHFLAIRDDGEGVPRDADGKPNFRYVATHICNSMKRRLKTDGPRRIARRVRHRAFKFLDRRRRASNDFGRLGSAGLSNGHA